MIFEAVLQRSDVKGMDRAACSRLKGSVVSISSVT